VAKLEGSSMRENVFIQACMPHKKNKTILPFYCYVLGISIFCLILTMVIYITSPELTSLTNQIMFHLSASLLIAYIVLIFIQRPEILEAQIELSSMLCRSLGHLEQFSFISAFMWITIMSVENMNQLDGCSQVNSLQQSSNTIKKLMLIGYGFPFTLTLGTGLVEMFSPECAIYKPRFGHRLVCPPKRNLCNIM
jgi:G protein-coupled receptor Mth (Methuselah protein)